MENETSTRSKEPRLADLLRATIQPGYTWLDMAKATHGRTFGEDYDLGIKLGAYAVVGVSEMVKLSAWGKIFYEAGIQNLF